MSQKNLSTLSVFHQKFKGAVSVDADEEISVYKGGFRREL